jgi:hypothetical protein
MRIGKLPHRPHIGTFEASLPTKASTPATGGWPLPPDILVIRVFYRIKLVLLEKNPLKIV